MQIEDFNIAVVTGGASGIGFAAAAHFLRAGLRVAIADRAGARLSEAEAQLAEIAGADHIIAVATDVTQRDDLSRLESAVSAAFGPADLLMNNAGIQRGSSVFESTNWTDVIQTNLMGIVAGCQTIGATMARSGRPGLIINTGSKQGITTPPGDPAYNVAKAGVKAFTEAMQHELRNMDGCKVSAHLLIPGFVYTGLTAKGRATKPDAAWTPEQTIDHMIECLTQDEFYILCPDNDVTDRATDERRILWAAGDIVESRPPLSRWHPDYKEAFAAFAAKA
jgi:NAD(P)-dependent dehydrogenase (short-subunit alcohol dehydrogenase family)